MVERGGGCVQHPGRSRRLTTQRVTRPERQKGCDDECRERESRRDRRMAVIRPNSLRS